MGPRLHAPRVVCYLLGGLALLLLSACGPSGRDAVPTPQPTAATHEELVARGAELAARLGCLACHTTDGRRAAGPTFAGLAGSEVELVDGRTVIVDSEYLRESIVDPDRKIRRGYAPGVMTGPVMRNLPAIEQGDNLDALVAYIESLR